MKGDNIMLNKEKYAKEILDIVCETGSRIGIINNTPIKCDNIQCRECKLCEYDGNCSQEFVKWANSEYKEREIDWNKVPVDTPIYVWDNNDNRTYKRHFAGYNKVNNMIIAFDNGGTSWSSGAATARWIHAKIKEGIDCSEWYKD